MVRCFTAVLLTAASLTAVYEYRWHRMRHQLIDEVERHLRDAACGAAVPTE